MIVYPNIITIGNLLCGMGAIVSSIMDRPVMAGYLIFIGMVFDFFDGKIARYINTVSNMGTYLDSLADFISFGIAPVVLVYEIAPQEYKRVVFYCLLIYVVCGFLRLMRYTFSQKSKKNGIFSGLPIPAAAGSLVSFIIVSFDAAIPFPLPAVICMIAVTSFLMVSNFPYRHFSTIISNIPFPIKAVIIAVIVVSIFTRCHYIFLLLSFFLYMIAGIERRQSYSLSVHS